MECYIKQNKYVCDVSMDKFTYVKLFILETELIITTNYLIVLLLMNACLLILD